jgi:hypothetical protein
MIGETRSDLADGMSPYLVVLRDAIVVFLIVLLSRLMTAGYPPPPEVLYQSTLTAAFTAIVSYAHASGIKQPEKK